jgi:hypothetical protein
VIKSFLQKRQGGSRIFYLLDMADDVPPPPAAVTTKSAVTKADKVPFVFPKEDVSALLKTSVTMDIAEDVAGLELFNQVSACIVPIDPPSLEATCLGYGATITANRASNPSRLAIHGIFGPVHRIKKQPNTWIDGSLTLTSSALYIGKKAAIAIKDVFGLNVQQLPGPFYVPPTETPKDTGGRSLWGFYPGTSSSAKIADGCVPFALVALTPVNVHFVPHTAQQRAQWSALTVGGGFNGGAELSVPLFRNTLQSLLEQHQEEDTATWALKAGDLFITHSGMPFCFSSPEGEAGYVVQAVGVELPIPQRRKWWKDVLESSESKGGLWKLEKSPEKYLCGYALDIDKDKPFESYTPLFSVARVEAAEWLTGPPPKTAKKKAVVEKKKEEEEVAAAGAEVVSAKKKGGGGGGGDGPKQSLLDALKLHTSLDEQVKTIPPRAWDPDLETACAGHRTAFNADMMGADSNKISSYKKCLATLSRHIEEAKKNADQLPGVLSQLDECKQILDGLEIPDDARSLSNRKDSKLKAHKELAEMTGNIIKKSKAISKLLEECKQLETAVEESKTKQKQKGAKRTRTPAASSSFSSSSTGGGSERVPVSPASIPVPDDIDEDNLEEMVYAGEELESYIQKISADAGRFDNMIKHLDRDELRDFYSKFYAELTLLTDYYKGAEDASYNVAIVDAYHDALEAIWNMATTNPLPSSGSSSSGGAGGGGAAVKATNSARGGSRIDCKDCGNPCQEFGDFMCKDCYISSLKERISGLDDAEESLRRMIKYARKNKTNEVSGIEVADLEAGYKTYLSMVKEIQGAYKKVKRSKNAIAPLLVLLEKAEEHISNLVPTSEGEGEGEGEENDSGGAMDIDSSSPGSVHDEDEEEFDDDDEEGGSEDEDIEEKKTVRLKKKAKEDENLADAILRAQIRTPIESKIKRIMALYLKGDSDSLGTVRTELRELGELTVIYSYKTQLKGDSKPQESGVFFASVEERDDKITLLQAKVSGAEFHPYEISL